MIEENLHESEKTYIFHKGRNECSFLTEVERCALLFEVCCNLDLRTGCCSFLIEISSNAAFVSP